MGWLVRVSDNPGPTRVLGSFGSQGVESLIGKLVHDMDVEMRILQRAHLLEAMDDTSSLRGIESLEQALEFSIDNDNHKDAFGEITSKAEPNAKEYAALVAMIMPRLPKTFSAFEADMLTRLARSGLREQAPSFEVVRDLFELMKYPTKTASETPEIIRAVFKPQGAPDANAGFWALVDWARSRFQSLRLDGAVPAAGAPEHEAFNARSELAARG